MNIRLEELHFIWNGGPGSGNFNPGQGRGVGKPNNQYKMSESFKEVFDEINSESDGEFKKEFDAVIENFRKNGVDTSKVKFVASKNDIPKSKREQLENDSIKGMTFSKKNLETIIYVDEDRMFDYGIDGRTSYKEGKQAKDQPWAADNSPIGIIKHELGHVVSYTLFMNSRGRKGTAGPILTGAVRLDINSRFKKIFGDNYDFSKLKLSRYGATSHGEAVAESFANPDFSEDTKKIYDYYVNKLSNKKINNSSQENDDWIQLCEGFTLEEISKNSLEKITSSFIDAITSFSEYIEKTINGGKGSGNHNPGQGRGKGKPNNSPSKIIDSYKEKYSDFWLNGIGDNGFETATKKGAENYKNIIELVEKQKDIEWGSGEYDRMTERIMDSQDEIENNFKTLCENNLTEHDFYKIKNLFYDWSTNLGSRGKDGLFLKTPGIILEKDSEAFGLYKAYIQTILYESGVTSKKLFRGESKKFESKPKQFVSYTDSMMSAVNFAHGNIDNVVTEEIPINKIIAVDDMMNFSGYRTEKEWIVDSGIYE